jgi:serine/threonine protein kinase
MEIADGTLLDLFHNRLPILLPLFRDDINVRRETVLETAEIIRNQIICLRNINNNYIYTDLKPQNILFKCRDQADLNATSVMLGDLGSAVPSGHPPEYISTYVAPEYKMSPSPGRFHLINDNAKYSYLSWQVGMLILFFFLPDVASQYNYSRFYWGNVMTSTDAQAMHLRTMLSYFFGPTIGNLVHPDPALRTDIRNPIYPSPDAMPVIPNVIIPNF